MRKLVIGLAAVVGLLVVIAATAPFWLPAVVPTEELKARIAQATQDATGRELAIKGDLRFSLLPRLELEVNEVAFANAPGASRPEMATLRQLVVQLQVLPLLLDREVKVDSFVLVEPVIHLEIAADGTPNWQLTGTPGDAGTATGEEPAETETKAEKETETEAPTDDAGPALREIALGDVRLDRGTVTYSDARSGQTETLSDINMKISLPSLDGRFAAEGSLTWHDEALTLTVGGDSLRGLLAGAASPVELALRSAPVTLDYDGRVTLAEVLDMAGRVDLNVPSIRALAAWAGSPVETGGGGLGPLRIKGRVAARGSEYAFTEAEIALDGMNATGDLTVETGGAKPYLKGQLALDRLDINTYLPPAQGKKKDEEKKKQAKSEKAGKGGPPPDWSDEPIDLSGLQAANANFDLRVGGILVQDMKIGKSALRLSLDDGLLVADLTELQLYGGSGKGTIVLNGRGAVPAVEKSFAIAGVDAEALLTDAAGFEDLEGTGDFNISVKTTGRSERQMVKALSGSGAVKFTDGAIKGKNLAAMARNVQSAFQGGGDTQKTDFAELSGTFKIRGGVLRNNDLLLLSPLLRLTGKGRSNLPKRTLKYRFEPKLVGTLRGQGGQTEAAGLTVPVIAAGPWHDIDYRPDLKGLLGDAGKQSKKALKKLKKGAAGDGELPDPGKALKKLFGN